jgi:hypothetical protein
MHPGFSEHGEADMKKLLAVAAVVTAFAPQGAFAQERGGDAALGAISGAVVFGPVGALAGAVVGYTAGPSIAHSWRMRRDPRRREPSANRSKGSANNAAPVPRPAPARQAANEASAPQLAGKGAAAQPGKAATPPTVMVPAQTLE